MDPFISDQVDPLVFADSVRGATKDLTELLVGCANTKSVRVETTHVLMAIATIPDGRTQRDLALRGIAVSQWREGLATEAMSGIGLPPAHLTRQSLDKTTIAMLEEAARICRKRQLSQIDEPILLYSALKNLTPRVRQLIEQVEIDLDEWCHQLERTIDPCPPPAIFDPQGRLIEKTFSTRSRKVLRLMQAEAESLGCSMMDPRHLLQALLVVEGGEIQSRIFLQGTTPRKVHEAVALSLRSSAKPTRSSLPIDRSCLRPLLCHILDQSAVQAASEGYQVVGECHLTRAFLDTASAARGLLEEHGIDVTRLARGIGEYDPGSEPENADDAQIADIETVRTRLQERLVGQNDAIAQVLPYVELMRFGFSDPGRPIGVFLFCGQSGSGKTEMAKELARAVYGSEENLIFLEMGQFNSAESMNIFVGAPPGYIGYGQGKLTNGLRDKPRAVVLFDEVEKANPKVLDALLRFLDEGKIDDPAGPVRDGSQCIVILTSNVGAAELGAMAKSLVGKPNRRTELRRALRKEFQKHKFRVEFLNRNDEVVLFRSLEKDDYVEIARRYLHKVVKRLKQERQLDVDPDPGVAQAIGTYCASIEEGARAVKRLTQRMVVVPVARFALNHRCQPGCRLRVTALHAVHDQTCEPEGDVAFAVGGERSE